MKQNIFLIITILILLTGLQFSCKKESPANIHLATARFHFSENDLDKALIQIDSIRLSDPKAYIQINLGERLSDSITTKLNKQKIDSLNEMIYEYQRQIYLIDSGNDGLKQIETLNQKIDSLKALKSVPRSFIDEIYRKEAQRMARCQCITAINQR